MTVADTREDVQARAREAISRLLSHSFRVPNADYLAGEIIRALGKLRLEIVEPTRDKAG